MKIILSPAKKMIVDTDNIAPVELPVFIDKTEEILSWMKSKSKEELQTIWKCNDKITEQNFNRLENMDLYHLLTPAVLSYEGIAFQYMAPSVFEDSQFEYVQNHLRIISAFYGVLKPRDGVTPYRLEMQAKLEAAKKNDLYEYWSDTLYQSLLAEGMTELVNLASAEYSKAILPYKNIRCITCIFGEEVNGKIKVKGTQAKIARGEMVRWMADQKIESVSDIREFKELGYRFSPSHSTEDTYTFSL